MILTLKLIGLAFEVNSAYLAKKSKESDSNKETVDDYCEIDPNLVDIIHYSLNYVGVLTGNETEYK